LFVFIVWNHVETISSTEDDALSYSSIIRPNQSNINRLPNEEITNTRRSISENISSTHQEFESTDENEHETSINRDDDHVIPKRRQSRATSSNNKVK
jgi:hypothetical protein